MKNTLLRKSLRLAFLALSLVGCSTTTSSTSSGSASGNTNSTTTSNFDTSKTIKVYTRDTTSGTRDGFMTKIGLEDAKTDNSKLVDGFVSVASNGDMVTSIKNDEYGIGYISLSSLASNTDLKGLKFENVDPTEENVLNNTYTLTRNFNYVYRSDYANDDKAGQIIKAFQAYLSTSDAKTIVKSNDGIVSITTSDPTWASIKSNYPICEQDNSSVTVKFGGSTSCDKVCNALTAAFKSLCGNFIPEHSHNGSGDAYKYTQGSEKDSANKLDWGWLSRELKNSEAAAEGTSGKICTDAIVAVVNSKNTYANTNAETLKAIYEGTKTKWSQVIA